jgi:hypothetical protein
MRVMPGGLEVRSKAATESRANTHEPLSSLNPGEMAMYDSGPGGGEYEGAKRVVCPAASKR